MAPKRVNLAAFVELKRDEGALEVETEDGTVFSLDPPEIWSDEQVLAARGGAVMLAPALLGDRWDEFVAKGGSANRLVHLLIAEDWGVSLGE